MTPEAILTTVAMLYLAYFIIGERPPIRKLVIGVDLGAQGDKSAVCVYEFIDGVAHIIDFETFEDEEEIKIYLNQVAEPGFVKIIIEE